MQHPFGHDAALHTHCPAVLQVWPVGHPPQAAPPVPQDVTDCAEYPSHVPLVQHPLGHVFASQAQVPLVVSQRPFVHGLHVAPPVPHDDPDWDAHGSHTAPLQHPLGQEAALQVHVPLLTLHVCPPLQAPHVAPPVPHDAFDCDAHGSHVPVGPPLQQPSGHDVASQTQLPVVLHSCPCAHALHAAPFAPHDEVDSDT